MYMSIKIVYVLLVWYAIATQNMLFVQTLLLVSVYLVWYKPSMKLTRAMRLKRNGGTHTTGEWLLLKFYYGNRCASCGRRNVKLTKDHILPVSKGGKDNISNIQPLCDICNKRKGVKTITY
jgi:5-methylcytosine-specific restriction endonuclease McrA